MNNTKTKQIIAASALCSDCGHSKAEHWSIKGCMWVQEPDQTCPCEAFNTHSALAAAVPEWVPVEQGNPPFYGWYLVTVRETNELGTFTYATCASFGNDNESGDCWFRVDGRIIAWMPLPTPYQEGRDGE